MDLATALRALPKAELHLHLDGSVRPATAIELAAEQGMQLTPDEARARLIGPPHCRDQAELLTYFDLPISLLQTSEALSRVTRELVADLADDGVRYAEIRWAPRLHLTRGLGVSEVIEAVANGAADARRTLGAQSPVIGLIVTAMRSHPPAANVELARTAAGVGAPVVGFDLAGPEATYPAPPHAAAFRAAEAEGLALTAHAGEVPGPHRIREAVELGVQRIAHGETTIDDPAILELVRTAGITLDLCPTSNVQAGVVAELAAHPLAALHRAGVSVTISTDDRTVSNVTLTDEMVSAARLMGLSPVELSAIASNAFARSFSPPSLLQPLATSAAEAWRAWAANVGAAIS